MNLRNYYRRIRETAKALADDVVLVSKATPEGGVAGRFVEAPRDVAARMIVDGAADLASDEDAARFRKETRRLFEEEERRRAAARIQVSVVTAEQVESLKKGTD
jgi:hypothetical protein